MHLAVACYYSFACSHNAGTCTRSFMTTRDSRNASLQIGKRLSWGTGCSATTAFIVTGRTGCTAVWLKRTGDTGKGIQRSSCSSCCQCPASMSTAAAATVLVSCTAITARPSQHGVMVSWHKMQLAAAGCYCCMPARRMLSAARLAQLWRLL
jgi:hypothetical protein